MAGAQAAWGIDVGVSSLKALKLRRDGDRVTVEAFEVLEHDKFLSEPDVDRDALTRSTLQKFMNKYGVRRDAVYIGVPGSTTFARFVKLPPVETKKIPEIVRFEAIQQIPFPLEQVNWDYHTFQAPDSPDVEVGIFAMKKDLVAQIMSNFRAVDMNVTGVQMSPLAVYNAAAYDGMTDDKGTIIIDMGAEHTDLVIMDQGRLWLRSINIGGNHFTDALAKSFKQQFGKAEVLKKTAATSKYQKQIYQAMRPIFADLVAEIQRSLGAYNSTHRDSRLERIVGMGNPFKLPNLQKYLQQELKIDVVRLESYRNANVEKAAAFSENILSMTTAYGLALQALGNAPINTNLLPVEIARAMMWKKKQPWFIGAAAVLALGAVGSAAQWYMAKSDFHNHQSEAEQNDRKMGEASSLRREWDGITGNYQPSMDAINAQFDLLAPRKIWPMVNVDVIAALPQARATPGHDIVITSTDAYYSAHLSAESMATGTTGQGGGTGSATGGFGLGAATAPAAGATATAPSSDHGFIVTVYGYCLKGARRPDEYAQEFKTALEGRGPMKSDKPYFFDEFRLAFHEIQNQYAAPKPQTSGGGSTFGGSSIAVSGGSGTPQAGDRPWGNVKGPFWEVFITDITGIKPPPATQPTQPGAFNPGGGGTPTEAPAVGDIPGSIDLYATRATGTPTPRYLAAVNVNTHVTFVMKFKVHLRDPAPATAPAQ